MNEKLRNKLEKRKQEGTLRSLSSFKNAIDFHSNDYLGIAKIKIENEAENFGGTGSRLISGSSLECVDLENTLQDFFKSEAALVFNSGYTANLGVFSAIPQKNDVVIYDEHIHASIRDGIRLSYAKAYGFRHNSLEDLERLLQKSAENKYVAVESLYSMHGDFCPVKDIATLCQKYDAHLIVDEAHAAGIFGFDGRGLIDAFELHDAVFLRIITFGKAYGRQGAVVLGNEEVKSYLVNFARPFIYTTALSSTIYASLSKIMHTDWQEKRLQLFENIKVFRSAMKEREEILLSASNSPIQILRIPEKHISSCVARMQSKGFAVKGLFPPTVPKGEEGIRICLHAFNSKQEIDELSKALV